MNYTVKVLFYCGGSYVYGNELSLFSIMRGLKKRGYQIHNISNGWNDGVFNKMLRDADIPYTEIKVGVITKSLRLEHIKWTLDALIHLPFALFKIARLIKKATPDVIFCQSFYNVFFLQPFLSNQLVIIRHAESPSANFFARSVIKNKNIQIKHLGISHYICDKLQSIGIAPNAISLLYNGFNIPKNQRNKIIGTKLAIGFAGRIEVAKGIFDLIEALSIIRQKYKNFSFKIAGSGDLKSLKKLNQLILDYNLQEHIELCGYVNDMKVFYNSIDLLILPSQIDEAFGRTPVEAGLLGIPTIVSDQGALPEVVVHGKTGFVVPSRNPEILANTIEKFFIAPDLIISLGQAAKSHYEVNFSLTKQLNILENILLNNARSK